jgi:hypothetical protein
MNITVTREEHWYASESNRPTGREYGFGVFNDDKLIGAITVNSLGRKVWSAIPVEDGVFVKSLEFQTKDDAVEYITKKWRSRPRT